MERKGSGLGTSGSRLCADDVALLASLSHDFEHARGQVACEMRFSVLVRVLGAI